MRVGSVLIKKLKAPVYKTSVWIVVSPDVLTSIDAVEDLIDHRIIEKKGRRATKAYTYGYENHSGEYRVLIFVTNDATPGTIAHEAHHLTNIILLWHGVKPSFANDEAESYYLEQIVDKIHNTIKQYNK